MRYPSLATTPLTGILLLASAACSDPAGPGPDLPFVETSAPEFAVEIDGGSIDAAVVATFTNRTRRPVYFQHCPPPLQLQVRHPGGDTWVDAYYPIFGCVGTTDTRKLDAGDSRTDTLHIIGCHDGSCGPSFEVVEGADYRIVYGAATERDLSEVLPLEDRVSNTFRLVVTAD